MKVCVILLSGGRGSRMKAQIPKQYLPLENKPAVLYSLDLFMSLENVCEIVVVCDPDYRHLFPQNITFADPGEQRQDSLFNGFKAITTKPDLVCTHDAARPMITKEMIERVLQSGEQYGAATVGMPIRFTVKECDEEQMVIRTPDRAHIYEIQTPQVVRYDLMKKGFAYIHEKGLTVTDDVSLAELLHHPVKLIEGSSENIKMTTPEDYQLLQNLLEKRL